MKAIPVAIRQKLLILKNGFFGHVLILVGGTAFSQVLLFLAYPVMSRLYQPDDFGAWSIIKSLSLIFSAIACWRYELSIVIPKQDKEAANLFTGSVLITTAMSFCLLIAVSFFGIEVVQLLSVQEILPWLWTLPLTLFLTGIYQSSNYWSTRKKSFSLLAVTRIIQSTVTVVIQLGLPFILLANASALVIGAVMGQVAATGVLLILIWMKDGNFILQSFSGKSIINGIFSYRNFPLYVAPYSFIGNFQQQMVLLLLGKFSSTSVVGLYAFSNSIVRLPISLIASSLNQVFFPKAAQQLESANLSEFVNKALNLLIIFTTPLFLFLIFNSTLIFTYTFGSRWSDAGNYAAWLSLTAFMLLYTSWLDRIYDVLDKQRLALVLEIIYDVISVLGFGVTLIWQKNPLFAVAVYSLITAVYNFVWLIVTFKIAKFKLSGIWLVSKKFIIIFCIFSIVHFELKYILSSSFVMIIDVLIITMYYIVLGLKYYHNRKIIE